MALLTTADIRLRGGDPGNRNRPIHVVMNYYEEFGLERAASVAQVRQAFKRIARMLHPDRCRDEPTRRLAELQLKRLNGVVEILSDPTKRAAYDLYLDCRAVSRPSLPRPSTVPPVRRWLVTALLT